MKVLLSRDVLKLAQASAVSKELKSWTWGERRYNIAEIEKDIPLLLKLLQSDECKGKSINTQARRVLSAHESLKTSGKDAHVKDLQGLEVLLRNVCAKAKNRWVFRPHPEFEWLVPYLVKNVRYREADRYTPARVEVTLAYMERGKRHNISRLFYRADCLGRPTAIEVLENASIYLADDALCSDYELDLSKYKAYAPCTGELVLGSGYGMQFETDTEPREGSGYQLWETVSEGSPITPVFATPEELAKYLVKHDSTVTKGTSYKHWMKFILGPGWAPSLIGAAGKGVVPGVQGV